MRDASIAREADDEQVELFGAALCVLIPIAGFWLLLVGYLAWSYWT